MSHQGNDQRLEQIAQTIVDTVSELWKLDDREDLLDDCIDYITDQYDYFEEVKSIEELMIEFLSEKAADAISSNDLDKMAEQWATNGSTKLNGRREFKNFMEAYESFFDDLLGPTRIKNGEKNE